jgi:hypothetical protein
MTDHINGIEKTSALLSHPDDGKHITLLPCQFRFARLSLVRITPLQRYHPNTLILNGIFSFQNLLLLFLSNYVPHIENLTHPPSLSPPRRPPWATRADPLSKP